MDKQPSVPKPSSGAGTSTLSLDYWRTHLQSGITFCLYVDSIIKDYKAQNIVDLKRYSQEDLLKGLMLYGMYPSESGRFKVLVKPERLDPEKLDKLDIYRKVRNILPDVDAMQMDVHWKEFMELCSERLFPLETRKKTETSKETPSMDRQSSEPGPSTGRESPEPDDEIWRARTESDRFMFYLQIGAIMDHREAGRFDILREHYSPAMVLRAIMFYGSFALDRDRRGVLMDGDRLKPNRLDKYDTFRMLRRIYPDVDVMPLEVVYNEYRVLF
ncbi:uncharacterized protein LOC141849668 [Brevipalpus obovatus]|uniref:uncharacterized protein LOC141849668 n=1 Tax=Brevipalpus obovatus TaxID=246614 RepID=UPI003D9F34A3